MSKTIKTPYYDLVVAGGGAAGIFAAINACETNSALKIVILEQSKEILNKVKISGGGRCNVTNACTSPKELISFYPRGSKELLGPFYSFGPSDTVRWFEEHQVKLHTESDGRMFPISNDSQTIIDCFSKSLRKHKIKVINSCKFKGFEMVENEDFNYKITSSQGDFYAKKLLLATGSSKSVWEQLASKGYDIHPPKPSLFTFNLPNHPIRELKGLSVENTEVVIKDTSIKTTGPTLITHWGLSGPAILKASAWGASILNERIYNFDITIDWIPAISTDDILSLKVKNAKRKILSHSDFGLPIRLWQFLISQAILDPHLVWANVNKSQMEAIIIQLKKCPFSVKGKTTFKEEFVTAGGVVLNQINFKNFESKIHPGLYMAGEILNIDALTGGFNFQAAWTGGYLAGKHIAVDG